MDNGMHRLQSRPSRPNRWWLAPCVAIVVALQPWPLLAGPSSDKPEAMLNVRSAGLSEQLIAAGEKNFSQASEALKQLGEKEKLAASDARQIGPTHVALLRIRRMATQLQARGEAAGWDLELRGRRLEKQLQTHVDALKQLPVFRTDGIVRQLDAAHKAGLKQMSRAQQLAGQGKLEPAFDVMATAIDEMERHAIWLDGTQSNEYFRPFVGFWSELQHKILELRRQQSRDELQAEFAKQNPSYDALLEQLAAAADEVGKTGSGAWKGQSVPGPEIINLVQRDWDAMQVATQRCRAICLVLEAKTEFDTLEANHRALLERLPAAIAAIVQADAQRATASEAPALYEQYLAAVAQMIAMGLRDELTAALEPALDQLAAKAAMADEVISYREATGELLRWKRRVARATAAARQKSGGPMLVEEFTEIARVGDQRPGVIPPPDFVANMASVQAPLDDVLRRIGPELENQPVTVPDIVTIAGGGRAVGRYGFHVYCLLSAPPAPPADLLEALRASLLVTPGNGPLSLEAAVAIAAAEKGLFERAGGQVEGVTLESLLSRFCTLTDGMAPMLPRGPLPDEPATQDMRTHVIARFDVVPTWVQHECFFVELAK